MKYLFPIFVCSFAMLLTACGTTPPPQVGGYTKSEKDNAQVLAAAKFAVQDQAKKQKVALELKQVLEAETQVVAGANYRMKLQVVQAGEVKTAQAVVWHQAWKKELPYQVTSWQWD